MNLNPIKLIRDLYYYVRLHWTNTYYKGTQLITRELSFERDPDGRWYAIVPEWQGSRAQLLMVAGADTVLELLSNHRPTITLIVSNDYSEYENWRKLKLAPYQCLATSSHGDYFIPQLNMNIWLCGVCEFVFGSYPQFIYFIVKE